MDILRFTNPGLYDKIVALDECIHILFARMDKNKDGVVTKNEVATWLHDFSDDNREKRKDDAGKIVHGSDIDGNYLLDPLEYRSFVLGKLNTRNLEYAIQNLRSLIETPCKHSDDDHSTEVNNI